MEHKDYYMALRWAIEQAARWRGSLTGNPDPKPLEEFDARIKACESALAHYETYTKETDMTNDAKKGFPYKPTEEMLFTIENVISHCAGWTSHDTAKAVYEAVTDNPDFKQALCKLGVIRASTQPVTTLNKERNYPAYAPTEQSDSAFLNNGFNPNLELKTRGGTPVAILTTNGPGQACIIGILISENNHTGYPGKLHRWNVKGRSYDAVSNTPRSMDLKQNAIRNFDWAKPYQTRCGYQVRLLTSNRQGERKYVALVEDACDREKVVLYYDNGLIRKDETDNSLDLINT